MPAQYSLAERSELKRAVANKARPFDGGAFVNSSVPLPGVRPHEELPQNEELRRRHMPPQNIEARAKGGPVKKGAPYLVGEKGPELFVPDKSGKVIAHAKLAKKMKENRKKKAVKGNPFYP